MVGIMHLRLLTELFRPYPDPVRNPRKLSSMDPDDIRNLELHDVPDRKHKPLNPEPRPPKAIHNLRPAGHLPDLPFPDIQDRILQDSLRRSLISGHLRGR